MKLHDFDRVTVADFGEQWSIYSDNKGYYGSVEYFFDIVTPLLTPEQVRGATVADIGSGTGRIVTMLLDADAKFVHALEPSAAFKVLKANTAAFADRIAYHHARGDQLSPGLNLDIVISIGVIHHIPDPAPTMRAIFAALRPGGSCLIWVYAREGNEHYLALVESLRRVTTRLPHAILAGLCHGLAVATYVYALAAQVLPLPLAHYLRNVFMKLDKHKRYLVIYDQLNPRYTKYYRDEEARALLSDAGFVEVRLHHRHGYSWTVAGRKP
jgi:2-polyprenyl-3-methyl-5-hydroxy-6-metoxy-1,4-benzoquinol methylase